MSDSSDDTSTDFYLFIDAESPPVANAEGLCREAVSCAFGFVSPSFSAGKACGINLKLAKQDEVQELNHRYRGKNKPTNVLSFPDGETMPDDKILSLGDIIIADEVVKKEALAENKPLAHHLQHLAVHGVLHLYGFDHETEEEAEIMESLECSILAKLKIPNPYQQ